MSGEVPTMSGEVLTVSGEVPTASEEAPTVSEEAPPVLGPSPTGPDGLIAEPEREGGNGADVQEAVNEDRKES